MIRLTLAVAGTVGQEMVAPRERSSVQPRAGTRGQECNAKDHDDVR
jgi:hypothetical protein